VHNIPFDQVVPRKAFGSAFRDPWPFPSVGSCPVEDTAGTAGRKPDRNIEGDNLLGGVRVVSRYPKTSRAAADFVGELTLLVLVVAAVWVAQGIEMRNFLILDLDWDWNRE
jgi:hypothetical protein